MKLTETEAVLVISALTTAADALERAGEECPYVEVVEDFQSTALQYSELADQLTLRLENA